MTAKEIKDYLRQYINADRRIDSRLEEISRLRAKAERITQTVKSDPVQTSPEDALGQTIDTIVDMEREVNEEIDALQGIRQQVVEAINLVPDDGQRAVLEYRYISGMSLEEIAVKIGYSYRQIGRLHKKSIESIKDVL